MRANAITVETDAPFGVARSFTGRRWRLQDADGADFALKFGISPVLARLLAGRGVREQDVPDLLAPSIKRLLPEPMILADMDKAVARVAAALRAGEAIAVFGDYDVDGSAAAALMQEYLAGQGAALRLYIPDRMTEGYGPNPEAMRALAAEGIGLTVCVDCGATAHAALEAARAAGMEAIVLDHHAASVDPPALAHVNPNGPRDDSGLTYLCAAGVVFLFLVALNRYLRESGCLRGPEPDLLSGLDLVALATVCDVVPLAGVNRAFVRTGLQVLERGGRPGLAALAGVAGAAAPFTPYTLGFLLGPRINAGGRVGRCSLGAELLSCRDHAKAEELAAGLDSHNRERQAIEKLILAEAGAIAETQYDSPFLLVAGEGWHPGVVGIVAGRLKERFNKPALVAGFEGGIGRGSARSVAGVDIGKMVRSAREAELIESGGGHAMAAGFSLASAQLEPLREFLAARFAEGGAVEPEPLTIETVLSPAGATLALIEEIAKLGPFGAGNAEPLTALPAVTVAFADVVGLDHVRLQLAGGDGTRLSAIAFRCAETDLGKALLAARGRKIHAAGRLRRNEWNGRVSPQLLLEDAAAAEA